MASSDQRYVVTFRDSDCGDSEAARILDVQKRSLKDGYEILGLADDVDESSVLHFRDLGASVVTLDDDGVKRLQSDERIVEVVPDFEVEAHGCCCGGEGSENPDRRSSEISSPSNLDPFSAGYQQAIGDLVRELGSRSGTGRSQFEATPRGCPPNHREICFQVFGRRFCFCVPDGPPTDLPPANRQPVPWNIDLVRADDVWHRVDGAGVDVAIIDTGIDNDHADLTVVGGSSFVPGVNDWNDDNGHGTHCAGIAGARNNSLGIVGVAPRCRLSAVKVLKHNPATGRASGRLSWILAGMGWCVTNGMDVASMSLGSCVTQAFAECTQAYQRAASRLIENGCFVVSSAGNSGRCPNPPQEGTCQSPGFDPCGPWVGRPARCPGFMAVAAIDRNRALASFSSRGPAGLCDDCGVEISAPGVSVNSTYIGGGYRELSGTSMACPHVAGAAALLKELHPTWTPDRIRRRLRDTADDLGVPGNDPGTGAGLLNCHRAVFG